MGNYVFSPSQLGFFANLLRQSYDVAGSWPGDAVDVTDEIWAQYVGQVPDGKLLGADNDGQPVWVDAPPPPAPLLAEQAAAMLEAGIQITSISNPALDGTYSCGDKANSDEGNLLVAIVVGLELPNNVVVRVDTSGVAHAFMPQEFKTFCQAKLTYQQQLNTIVGSGQGDLPVQPTVIP